MKKQEVPGCKDVLRKETTVLKWSQQKNVMKRAQTTGYHGCQRFNVSKALDLNYLNSLSLLGDATNQ